MTDYNRLGVKYMIECNDGMTTIVYTGDGKSVRQLPFGVTLPFTVKEIKQMNRFEELRKLAEEAEPAFERYVDRGRIAGDNLKIATYIAEANPQTILAMLDLIELQHEALESTTNQLETIRLEKKEHWKNERVNMTSASLLCSKKASAAYNKFKEQS